MAKFRNVSNNGYWQAGGTYSFEAYFTSSYIEQYEPPICTIDGYVGFAVDSYFDELIGDESTYTTGSPGWYWYSHSGDGNILFDNNNGNAVGGVGDTEYDSMEDLGGGWYKITITLPSNLSSGVYYFKVFTGASVCSALV